MSLPKRSVTREVLAFAKTDKLFAKVLEAEKMYLSDDKMREFYRQNEEAYWRGVLATAKAESKAEGRAEGIAEGIAEGEASVKLHKYVTKSIGLSEWQKEDQR